MVLIEATDRVLQDAFLLSQSAYAPLQGFLAEADHRSVLERMATTAGRPWTVPINLPLPEDALARARADGEVLLARHGAPLARVQVEETFRRDLLPDAALLYGTLDPRHPGVASLLAEPPGAAAGPVEWLDPARGPLPDLPPALSPADARALFRERGWRTVVGFQTRNAPHRGHEHLLRLALEYADGLFIHPLVGARAPGDLPAQALLDAYDHLARGYFRPERVALSPLFAPMRYAGPREAVHHALVRRNYGCTHFVVGRDHAGVGGFYGPYDAHAVFDRFAPGQLGIEPLRFFAAFHCDRCDTLVTEKVCPHPPEARRTVSGTQMRAGLRGAVELDARVVRPDVAAAVRASGGGVP